MRIDDTRPIWIQLADNFRARITDGTWKPGQKIPSVRDLAIEAGTNPNTVQRALAALDDAPLRGETPEGRLRGDVLQEGGRQELRLQAEADVAEAVAPLDGERTPAARLDAGERPDEMRHRRPVLAALRIGPGVVGDLAPGW